MMTIKEYLGNSVGPQGCGRTLYYFAKTRKAKIGKKKVEGVDKPLRTYELKTLEAFFTQTNS